MALPKITINQNKILTQRLGAAPVKTPAPLPAKIFVIQPTDLFIGAHAAMAPKCPQLTLRQVATEMAAKQAAVDLAGMHSGIKRR